MTPVRPNELIRGTLSVFVSNCRLEFVSMPSDFHRELLSSDGMLLLREALIEKYEWFIHDSNVEAFRLRKE